MNKLVLAYFFISIAINWHEVDCQNWPQDVARADKVRQHYGDVQQSGSFGGQNFKIFSFLTTQPNLAYGSSGVQKQSRQQASVKVGGSGLPPYLPPVPTTKKLSTKQTKGQRKPDRTRKRKKTGMYVRYRKPPPGDTPYYEDDGRDDDYYWDDDYYDDEEVQDDYRSAEDSRRTPIPRKHSKLGIRRYEERKKTKRPKKAGQKTLQEAPKHQQNPMKWEEVLKQAEDMVAGKDADGFDSHLNFFDSLFGKQFDDLEKLAKPVKPKQTLRSGGPQGPLGG